jgi:hypothetical protein
MVLEVNEKEKVFAMIFTYSHDLMTKEVLSLSKILRRLRCMEW